MATVAPLTVTLVPLLAYSTRVAFRALTAYRQALLAGSGTGADKVLVAVGQTDLLGTAGHVHGPVGAGVALDGAVITQSGQQHLQEGKAGQGVLGTEGAVGIAVDQAGLHAVGDVAREGRADRHSP